MTNLDTSLLPGSARDDFTAVKMLFLRWNNLDLSTKVAVTTDELAGVKWKVTFTARGVVLAKEALSPTEAVQAMRAELVTSIANRARSDLAVLQLTGDTFTAFDTAIATEGEAVVEGGLVTRTPGASAPRMLPPHGNRNRHPASE